MGITTASFQTTGIHVGGNTVNDNAFMGIVIGSAESEVTGNTVSGNSEAGIWVTADNTLVQDNHVSNTTSASQNLDNAGIRVTHASQVDLIDNTLENNAFTGLYVTGSDMITISGHTITANELHGIVLDDGTKQVTLSGTNASGNRTDLKLISSEQVTVSDNTFDTGVILEGNQPEHFQHTFGDNDLADGVVYYSDGVDDPVIPANARQIILVNATGTVLDGKEHFGVSTGIQLAFSDNITVSDGNFSDQTWNGFSALYSDNLTFSGNTIDGNQGHGIRIENSDSINISGNEATVNKLAGLYVQMRNGGSGLTVHNNEISANEIGFQVGQAGFSTGSLAGVTVTDNRFADNTEIGVLVEADADSEEVVINQNDIEDNGSGLLYDGSFRAPDLDARENWWGSNTGPGGGVQDPETGITADGTGDTVGENVLFDPWLEKDDEPSPEITECMEINQPGSYVLATDLEHESTCILITVSDVTLDGNGYSISQLESGVSSHSGLEVAGGELVLENVAVRNLALNDWHTGVEFDGVENGSLSDVQVTGSATGLRVRNVKNSSFEDILTTENDTTVVITGGSSDNSFEAIGIEDTEITLDAAEVSLAATEAPAVTPDEADPLGLYLEIESISDDAEVTLIRFHYTDDLADGLDENKLTVWRYAEGAWHSPDDESYSSGVDTENQFVYAANITDFSIFGVFSHSKATSTLPEAVPAAFALRQNYPNPFNPTTQIRFDLPESAQVRLDVFNSLGQRVATLVNETKSAGSHEISFDAEHLSSGHYIYRLEASGEVFTRTMTLIK